MVADVKALLAQGIDLNTVGIGGDPLNGGVGLPDQPALAETSALASPNGTTNYAWAQADFIVPPATVYGNFISGVVSLLNPSLCCGKSWNDFHYYNRIVLGSNTNNCGQQDKFTLGAVKGKFGSTTFSTPTIVFEEYDNHVCGAFSSPMAAGAATSVRIRRIAVNTWQGEAWNGSSWFVVFSSTPISWGQDGALRLVSGHEYYTFAGDKTSMTIPTNFITHTFVNSVPFSDPVLPSGWAGHTTYDLDSPPFTLYDAVNGDYTAVSIKAN